MSIIDECTSISSLNSESIHQSNQLNTSTNGIVNDNKTSQVETKDPNNKTYARLEHILQKGLLWAKDNHKFDKITNQPKIRTLIGLIIGQKISFQIARTMRQKLFHYIDERRALIEHDISNLIHTSINNHDNINGFTSDNSTNITSNILSYFCSSDILDANIIMLVPTDLWIKWKIPSEKVNVIKNALKCFINEVNVKDKNKVNTKIDDCKIKEYNNKINLKDDNGLLFSMSKCKGIGPWTIKAYMLMCDDENEMILLKEDGYIQKMWNYLLNLCNLNSISLEQGTRVLSILPRDLSKLLWRINFSGLDALVYNKPYNDKYFV